jgi:hypothetical protein
MASRRPKRDGELLQDELPTNLHVVGDVRHRGSEIVQPFVNQREPRCSSPRRMQGNGQDRVEDRSRGSLGPDESPEPRTGRT